MKLNYIVGHFEWDKFVPYVGFFDRSHAEQVLDNLAKYKRFHNLVTSIALREASTTRTIECYQVVKGKAIME